MMNFFFFLPFFAFFNVKANVLCHIVLLFVNIPMKNSFGSFIFIFRSVETVLKSSFFRERVLMAKGPGLIHLPVTKMLRHSALKSEKKVKFMEVNIYFTYFFIYVEPNYISRKPTHLLGKKGLYIIGARNLF